MKKLKIGLCILMSLALLAVSGCGTSSDAADNTLSTTTTTAAESCERDVAFFTNANVRLNYDASGLEYPVRFGGHVLVSKTQFDRMKLDELELFGFGTKEQVMNLTPYTEAYFADKALVVLFMTSGAGNVHMRVDKLTVNGDVLKVAYTEQGAMVIEDDGSDWCLLLEVDAAAVQNVTAVVGEKTVETLTGN